MSDESIVGSAEDLASIEEASRKMFPNKDGGRSGCCYLTLPSGKRECFNNHTPRSCQYMGQQAHMPHQWAPGSCQNNPRESRPGES